MTALILPKEGYYNLARLARSRDITTQELALVQAIGLNLFPKVLEWVVFSYLKRWDLGYHDIKITLFEQTFYFVWLGACVSNKQVYAYQYYIDYKGAPLKTPYNRLKLLKSRDNRKFAKEVFLTTIAENLKLPN